MGFHRREEQQQQRSKDSWQQQQRSKDGELDCFVAIDMENLQSIEATNYSPRIQMEKVLSRKGSQRLGAADVDIKTNTQSLGNSRFNPVETEHSEQVRVVELVETEHSEQVRVVELVTEEEM